MANRIWIYQSDRVLNAKEQTIIQESMDVFCGNWMAHGKDLEAKSYIKDDVFLILMVDEQIAEATGCSIDSSVHFITKLAKELNIDFFNRLNTVYQTENSIEIIHSSKLDALYQEGKINEDTIFLNPLVQSEEELESKWAIPFSKHWAYRMVNQKTTV